VKEGPARNLEVQSYLQRSGEALRVPSTRAREKDVGAGDQDHHRGRPPSGWERCQATLLPNDVLRTNKIRSRTTTRIISYAQKSMMLLVKGKPDDVAVNVITPEHAHLRQ